MSYKFADHLLLRMPVKSWSNYGDADLQTLLTDPLFRSAIYIASPGFYSRLERVQFDHDQLNIRERYTLKKYYNRICFRPTPFGLFSSVALIGWGAETIFDVCNNNRDQTPCIDPDRSYLMALGDDLLTNELKDSGLFVTNSTLYRVDKEFRFIRTDLDEAYKKRDYDLQSIDYSTLLKNLTLFCKQGKSKSDIVKYLIEHTGCSVDDGEEYFDFMADSQLLVNQLRPNITGCNYADRLVNALQFDGLDSERSATIKEAIEATKIKGDDLQPATFINLNEKLKKSLPPHLAHVQDDQLSVILKNDSVAGTLGLDHQQNISDALFALDRLLPREQVKGLHQFIKLFKKHFEQQAIPLLTAIDPEVGIGYQSPDNNAKNPLLETLNIYKPQVDDGALKWTAAHSYLLDRWHSQAGDQPAVIRLQKDELLKLNSSRADIQTAGMSALFRIVNKKLLLETAGGVNAPALLGRFTVADESLRAAARKMAVEVEAANPDIIFAELVHLVDPHLDNINRRERIWTYELPITANSLVDDEQKVELSDLQVSVENDMVILRSIKHRKIVIPRLTSAYNHSLNKLPLFCFLADVPYQYFKSSFTLNLSQFFPGLPFYPRVEYLDTILHLATWILKINEIENLSNEDDAVVFKAFDVIAKARKLPAIFSLVQGDQQLVFYRDKPDDVLLFAECLKNKEDAILKEYLIDNADTSLIKDKCGNCYVSQFNAFMYTATPLPFLPKPASVGSALRPRRQFILGSEWLYLKFYLPRIGVNSLLLKIWPLLKHRYSNGAVKKWFFIRYDDHAPHIRVRLKINPLDLSEILIAFKHRLDKTIGSHVIREYQTDIYSRELERYEAANYDLTEDFFWRSSELVMQYLKTDRQHPGRLSEYGFAMASVRDILMAFLPDHPARIAFVQTCYAQFLAEFDDKKINVQLDKKYRELSKNINADLNDPNFYSTTELKNIVGKFVKAAQHLALSAQKHPAHYNYFLSSIIHMHVNRIFVDDSRKQEMITYYFLHKFFLSDMARKKGIGPAK